MAGQKILVPYNFTHYDDKVLDFVINNFLQHIDYEITLFYAYTAAPKIEMQNAPVMGKIKDSLSFLNQKIKEQEEGLKKVAVTLVQNGFKEENVNTIFKPRKKDIAVEIIELARNQRSNIIVINHRPGKIKNFYTGSVFNKVVSALRDSVVCIVS